MDLGNKIDELITITNIMLRLLFRSNVYNTLQVILLYKDRNFSSILRTTCVDNITSTSYDSSLMELTTDKDMWEKKISVTFLLIFVLIELWKLRSAFNRLLLSKWKKCYSEHEHNRIFAC